MHDPDAVADDGRSVPSVSRLSLPLAAARGWMKFIGIILVIQGALSALTLVGIVVAWLPVWMGVLLLQSADAIARAEPGDDAQALQESLARLRTYFVIQRVLLIIGIVLTVPYFMFFGAFALSMLRQYPHFY